MDALGAESLFPYALWSQSSQKGSASRRMQGSLVPFAGINLFIYGIPSHLLVVLLSFMEYHFSGR